MLAALLITDAVAFTTACLRWVPAGNKQKKEGAARLVSAAHGVGSDIGVLGKSFIGVYGEKPYWVFLGEALLGFIGKSLIGKKPYWGKA